MSRALLLRRRSLLQRIAAGGGFGNGPDDEFVYGSSIDTAGLRYFGAYPWTLRNQRSGTATVSGGQLSMLCSATSNLMDPIIATEAMDAGDGIWRAQTDMSIASNSSYQGVGIMLREASTGKMLCFGYANDAAAIRSQIRRMPATSTSDFTTWSANYDGTPVTNYTGYLEIIRDGSTLYFLRSTDASNWIEATRVAQTVDFTTAPDQVGLWVNTVAGFGNTRTGIFEYFRKVTRSVPYNVPIVNPGAELAIASPWTNVTGTLGTRNGVQRSGANAFKLVGNPGNFEVYQEWSATHFASLFDAGGRTATFAGWGAPWTGASTTYRLRLNAYDSGGSSLGSATTAYWTPSGTYSQKSAVLSVPTGTRKLRMTIEGTTAASDDGWWDDLTLVIT